MAIEIDFGRELGRLAFPDDITDEQAKSYVRENYQAIRQGLLDRRRQELAAETESEEAAKFRAGEYGLAETAINTLTELPKGALKGIGEQLGGFARVFEAGDPFTEIPLEEQQRNVARSPITQAGQQIEQFAEETYPGLPGVRETMAAQVMGGIGSTASTLPAALAAGPAAPLTAGIAYGLQSGEAAARDADRVITQRIAEAMANNDVETARDLQSRREQIKSTAFAATAPIGAASEVSLGITGKLVNRFTKGRIGGIGSRLAERMIPRSAAVERKFLGVTGAERIRGAVEGMATEGAQEFIEETGGNVVAGAVYDPERGWLDGSAEAGFIGAVTGGLLGGLTGSKADAQLAAAVREAAGADPTNPLPRSNATVAGIEDTTPTEGYSLEPEITEEDVLRRQAELGIPLPEGVPLPAPAAPAPAPAPEPTPVPEPAVVVQPTPAAPEAVSPETGLTADEQDELDQLITAEDAGLLSEEGAITLAAYRSRLGVSEPAPVRTAKTLTREAVDLLAKVDAGGVPMSVTANLERIANENGITVTGSDTPNTIISQLRQKLTPTPTPSAVQEQGSDEGVLRREGSQVGLQEVDRGGRPAEGQGSQAQGQAEVLTTEGPEMSRLEPALTTEEFADYDVLLEKEASGRFSSGERRDLAKYRAKIAAAKATQAPAAPEAPASPAPAPAIPTRGYTDSDFAAAPSREAAAEMAVTQVRTNPSLPPRPPQIFYTLQAVANRAARKPYDPQNLTAELIKQAQDAGLLTAAKNPKLTSAGQQSLADGTRQSEERKAAQANLSDALRERAVLAWDAANDPQSAAYKEKNVPAPAPVTPAPAQPKAPRKPRQESQQRLDAREFNRIAIDLAPDLNLIDDPAVLSPVFQGGLKDKGMIQADIARRQGIALVVRRLVQMLGGDPQKTSEADRAALLPKLRELAASTETNRKMQAFDAAIEAGGPVQLNSDSLAVGDTIVVGGSPLTITAVDPDTMAATADGGARYGEINIPAGIDLAVDQYTPVAEEAPATAPAPAPVRTPRLGAGQTQGDLIASTQREDLRLIGEEGIDIEARQARAREAARQAAEARAAQRKAQTTMQLEAAPLPTVSQATPAQQAAGVQAAAEAQGRELGPEPTGKPQTLEEATAGVRDAIGQLIESITPKAGFTGGPSASDSLKRLLREIPPAVLQSAALIAQRVYRETRDWAKATQAGIEEIFSRVKVADLEDTRAGFSEFIQGVNVPGSVPAVLPQPAPGQERVDSRGYFTGQINPETVDNWESESKRVVESFGTDMEAAFGWALKTDLDAASREFILRQILERVFVQIARSEGKPMETIRAENLLRRVQASLKTSGTLLGQAFNARGVNVERIWYLHPLLAFRDLVRERQAQIPFPEKTSEQVRQWLQGSARQAIEEIRLKMRDANNAFGREFRRITKDVLRREDINWEDILTASEQRQGSMQYRLLEEILSQPGLRNLPPRGISEIVKLFSTAWAREQERIFRNEFRKQVKLPTVNKDILGKIEESIPRILRYSNIAMMKDDVETRLLWDEAFRNAVAPQFGVAAIDGSTARKLTALAQKAQSVGGINRNEIIQQMFRLMQNEGGINWKDIVRDYWYAAVLSGSRTQVDNGMNMANGLVNTVMLAGMAKSQGGKVLKAAGRGVAEGVKDFWPILAKGELYRSVNFNPDNPGNALEGIAESRRLFLRGLSIWKYVSRLMIALDHINALMNDASAKAYNLAKIKPELLETYLLPSAKTVADARARAIAEGTRPELVNRRTREIIEEVLPDEVLLTARDIRQMATFTEVPQGLLGVVYQMVNSGEQKFPLFKFLSGTNFVRFTANWGNELLNHFAPVALWRLYHSAPGKQDTTLGLKYSETRRDLIKAKMVFGSALIAYAGALFLGDDDDEKKRAIDITGSFKSLSPEKRNQLLAEGRQPYSIRVGDTYISYRQMGFGGVLGAIGELRDQQLYSPEKYTKQGLADKLLDGFVSGALIIKDASSIAALTEFLGFANAYKYDVSQTIEKATPKYLARLAGSVIPNIMKEADAWIDSSIYRAEPGNLGMEYFLQQVPFARQSIGPGPILNVLGEPVQVERYPYSRWLKFRKEDKAWNTLGQLASKGVFMPTPNITVTVKENGERRRMNRDEAYTYQKDVGQRYRTWIERNGDRLLKMKPDDAADVIDKAADRMRADAREKIQQKVRR